MKIPIKDYFQLLGKYMMKQKLRTISLFLIIIVNLFMQLYNPRILGYFIDGIKGNYPEKSIIIAVTVFIIFGVSTQLLSILATYVGEKLGWTSTNELRMDLIEHCIGLDMGFHKNHQSGEMLERIDGDINALFTFFSTLMIKLVSNIGLVAGIIVLLVREDYRIGTVLIGIAVLDWVIMMALERFFTKFWETERSYEAELYGFLGEQVTSVEDITTSGAKGYVMNKLYSLFRKIMPVVIKADLGYYSMWAANVIVFAIANVAALWLSIYLYSNSVITLGTVYMIFYYTELLNGPLEEIRNQLQRLQSADASIKRVKELFKTKTAIKYGYKSLEKCKGIDVDVQGVSFNYEDDEPVLKNIDIEIKENKILGILGHTGSGKTTLARLIARIYDVNSGSILINGIDIKDIKKESLLSSMSYVTQEVEIFKGTLRDNLTMFNDNIKDHEIMDIIKSTGIERWLNKMPEGLDTVLESGGNSLSAGEAQLVAFIRVFLKNPKLVILDEATSRLDPITENMLEKALSKLIENRTCIIIAHRLKTVERADDIMILKDGEVIESGNRRELIQDNNSKFAHLIQVGMEEVLA